jgi:hypothetical protein
LAARQVLSKDLQVILLPSFFGSLPRSLNAI